jgi:hypothetical protein
VVHRITTVKRRKKKDVLRSSLYLLRLISARYVTRPASAACFYEQSTNWDGRLPPYVTCDDDPTSPWTLSGHKQITNSRHLAISSDLKSTVTFKTKWNGLVEKQENVRIFWNQEIKMSLSTSKNHTGERDVKFYSFVSSELDGGELTAQQICHQERIPSAQR